MRYLISLVYFVVSCYFTHAFVLTTLPNALYTTFEVYYPDAHLSNAKVYLRGDNCNLTWNQGILLNKTSSNTWKTVMLCPENITISVKALLNDSKWMFGNNRVFRGGQRTVEIYPSFFPTNNKVIDKTGIASKILNNTRKCSLYYPPSFNDNTLKQYEVLILHDGQNLFEDSQAAFGTAWHVQDTVTQLIAEGGMREIIIVGVWNTPDRNNQYTYSYDPDYKFGGKGDKYLDFLQQQLMPIIQNDWFKGRVKGDYGIGGSSLGGLISCYAAYTRPDVFKTAICMSSSFWWNNEDFNGKILSQEKVWEGLKLYVDSGDSGSSQDGKNQTVTVYNHLSKIGYRTNQTLFYYLDKGGQHNEYYWGRRFNVPMLKLYS